VQKKGAFPNQHKRATGVGVREGPSQTPSTGLRHPVPSTTAVFSYAIGSRKLSANEQFFVGAQTVIRLLQTTQIISRLFYN